MTCLYRAGAESWASRFEALGIATEFAPSVLVARLLGVAEFALGSTMVFRADSPASASAASRPSPITWPTITSWAATSPQLGYRIEFAPVVVETHLGAGSWAQTWRHQLRWSRTIRVSRASGYYGYVGHARHAVGPGGARGAPMAGGRGRRSPCASWRASGWARGFSAIARCCAISG